MRVLEGVRHWLPEVSVKKISPPLALHKQVVIELGYWAESDKRRDISRHVSETIARSFIYCRRTNQLSATIGSLSINCCFLIYKQLSCCLSVVITIL